jgi:hypothetical protein
VQGDSLPRLPLVHLCLWTHVEGSHAESRSVSRQNSVGSFAALLLRYLHTSCCLVSKSRSTKEYMRKFMRTYRAAGRDHSRSAGRDRLQLPFVAVDGEGGNLESGYHAYFLLRAGDAVVSAGEGNVRLTTEECLDFLSRLDPRAIYVAYFFDYDVTKILEDLGWTKLDRLINRNKRRSANGHSFYPVDYRGYQVDYLPKKEFKVRRLLSRERILSDIDRAIIKEIDCNPETMGTVVDTWSPWVVINDVGSFYQCRFVEALEKWQIGSAEERADIQRGKDARADFTALDDEIYRYNALECVLLAQLMEAFRDACIVAGYVPARWQGPGLLAEAMFAAHNIPKTADVPLLNDPQYEGLLTFARNAFYGGRPEISALGPVNRPMFQFDLNSAYPAAMLSAPCLMHGEWSHETYQDPIEHTVSSPATAIVFGSFVGRDDGRHRPNFYGLPVRSETGTIIYPASGRGWYWAFEVATAVHQRFNVEERWVYRRTCVCQPFAFVSDVYAERRRLGADGAGGILKLGLNSMFGKTVQSVGSPKYANAIWGSYFTAHCRAAIARFIHTSEYCRDPERWCGKDVLMIATDSVATFNPRPDITPSTELGGWSVETHPDGMFLVQPGLYFGSSGKPSKTRGVPRSVIEEKEQEFRDAFARMVASHKLADGDVYVPQTMFCGIRYTLHRHNLKLLGQWITFTNVDTGREGKVIRFDWGTKRARHPVLEPLPGVHDYMETFPQEGDPALCTVPYSKDIGGLLARADERLVYEEQPDWARTIEGGDQ